MEGSFHRDFSKLFRSSNETFLALLNEETAQVQWFTRNVLKTQGDFLWVNEFLKAVFQIICFNFFDWLSIHSIHQKSFGIHLTRRSKKRLLRKTTLEGFFSNDSIWRLWFYYLMENDSNALFQLYYLREILQRRSTLKVFFQVFVSNITHFVRFFKIEGIILSSAWPISLSSSINWIYFMLTWEIISALESEIWDSKPAFFVFSLRDSFSKGILIIFSLILLIFLRLETHNSGFPSLSLMKLNSLSSHLNEWAVWKQLRSLIKKDITI